MRTCFAMGSQGPAGSLDPEPADPTLAPKIESLGERGVYPAKAPPSLAIGLGKHGMQFSCPCLKGSLTS